MAAAKAEAADAAPEVQDEDDDEEVLHESYFMPSYFISSSTDAMEAFDVIMKNPFNSSKINYRLDEISCGPNAARRVICAAGHLRPARATCGPPLK